MGLSGNRHGVKCGKTMAPLDGMGWMGHPISTWQILAISCPIRSASNFGNWNQMGRLQMSIIYIYIHIYIDFHIILIPYLPNDLKPVVLPGTPHGSTLAPGPIARFDQGSYSSSSSEKKKYLGETRRESVENLFWIRGWGWVESGGITMWQPLHYNILYTYLGTVESLSPWVFPTFVSISSSNSVIIQWTPVSLSWQQRHVWPPEEEKEEQEEAGTGRWR